MKWLIAILLICMIVLTGCSTTQKIKAKSNCVNFCENKSMKYQGCPTLSPFGKYTCECNCYVDMGETGVKNGQN